MLDFFQMIASGIAVGSSYALMGLAMVIIYNSMASLSILLFLSPSFFPYSSDAFSNSLF
jgi:hypothetical protein